MPELADRAAALADGIEAALPTWIVGCVVRVHRSWNGTLPPGILAEAEGAGQRARCEVGALVRQLLQADIDEQWTTPLALLRGAVRYPGEVLAGAGVPPVARTAEDERMFPDDRYGLVPASLADVGLGLQELGLAWGAAKAWAYRRRHGAPR